MVTVVLDSQAGSCGKGKFIGYLAQADNADVDAPMFNIAGQRVSNSAKGLVIKNGKKYMLK